MGLSMPVYEFFRPESLALTERYRIIFNDDGDYTDTLSRPKISRHLAKIVDFLERKLLADGYSLVAFANSEEELPRRYLLREPRSEFERIHAPSFCC